MPTRGLDWIGGLPPELAGQRALGVAGVAVLAGNLRHRLGRAADRRRHERGMAHAYVSGLQFASDRDQLHDESLPCR